MAKLVVIGDSLSQGFASGAIYRPDMGYAALLARWLKLAPEEFRMPSFDGYGGLPLNVEWLLRELDRSYGPDIRGFEWPRAIFTIHTLLDKVEDYWEREAGCRPIQASNFHNLAVWGFKVGDAFRVTGKMCREKVEAPKDDFINQIPSKAMYRTAWRVLNPSQLDAQDHHTQISRAKEIAEKENGIDILIVWLGTNNALGTVLDLEIRETTDIPPDDPDTDRNLWTDAAFAKEYAALSRQVQEINAEKVIVANIPHVTIAPVTRGVNTDTAKLAEGEKYFDYYTRFWIRDHHFDPNNDPHLTKGDVQLIDNRIDSFNTIIKNTAEANGWQFVDICTALDRAAKRRNHEQPVYDFPKAYIDRNLDTGFLRTDNGDRLSEGGLFSLDGVHPTHCGYALIAREFIRQAIEPKVDLDTAFINAALQRDTLVNFPPRTLFDIFDVFQTLEEYFHFSRWISNC